MPTVKGGRVPARRFRNLMLACLLGLGVVSVAHATDGTPPLAPDPGAPAPPATCGERLHGDDRPRIGLALGGGGARGIAHISVLEKLEALQVPVDCIAGTSAGALVGALYAAGRTPAEIADIVRETDWEATFADGLPRQERTLRRKAEDYTRLTTLGLGLDGEGVSISAGLSEGIKLMALFEDATGSTRVAGSFDDLPIPFRAVATDVNTGEAVVLDGGSLPLAMRASMSLPAIMRPVEVDGRMLLDGGLANQVPVDVVRAMGADRVIAVDVGTPLGTHGRNISLLEVIDQMTGFLTTRNAAEQLATLGPDDVLIAPDLGDDVASADFDKAGLALQIGREAADAAGGSLARLSVDASTYASFQARHRAARPDPRPVAFVEMDNRTGYDDAVLRAFLPVEEGEVLDADAMHHGLEQAYGMGTLSSISYQRIDRDGEQGVRVTAVEKPHGPTYLEAGLSVSDDLRGNQENNLRAALLFSPLSSIGSEGRVVLQIGSEPGLTGSYYHPFDVRGRHALDVIGGFQSQNINIFDDAGNKTDRYRVKRYGLTSSLVRNFGNTVSVSVALSRYRGSASQEIGSPQAPDLSFDEGAATFMVEVDDIDSLFFPRDGVFMRAAYTTSREWLGSDTDFDQADVDVFAAQSFGAHSLQLGARYHATVDGVAPVQSLYRLGGRWRLAGFQHNQLTGQAYALGFAGYTYELGEWFGRSAQVGGTVEYGNAWQDRHDMALDDGLFNGSLFIGFDSWVGPLIFGMGFKEGGGNLFFLELGESL